MTSDAIAPLWICEEQDGTKELCDLTGAVVDMTAVEAACEARDVKLILKRPSEREEAHREADEKLFGRPPALLRPLGDTVDIRLQQFGADIDCREEVPLGQTARELHRLLTEHNLIAPPA